MAAPDRTWMDKIANTQQLGGIETAVLDNGAARGTRIAWVNTGTGLSYKVVLDRAMDIADAFYKGCSLAWIGGLGVVPPQPAFYRGAAWLRTFGGGLVTTCGLSHVGGPDSDAYGERGLHGHISNTPAEVTSIIQPDLFSGNLAMSISGCIRETTIFGPHLWLKRTILGAVGKPVITIKDEVVNAGNTSVPHMLLYHINLGWPLVDEGASVFWQGSLQPRSDVASKRFFHLGNNFYQCPAPLPEHAGAGEAAAFIDAAPDETGRCVCGVYNPHLDIALAVRFYKAQLPWLTNWQHWGKKEYVLGLEPGTNPPVGQAAARAQNQLRFLEPGAALHYELELEVLEGPEAISGLRAQGAF